VMFGLVFAKMIATSISLGSGGSGGIFAPSLFLGTMTGGFFGGLVHKIIPEYSASSGAYSLVGMGAVVAGATHAPITAILIIFELTNDYAIILPLMISSIIATVLTTKFKKESIYTLKLVRRGIDLFRGREINVLKSLRVSEVLNKEPVIIRPDLNFKELLELVVSRPNTQFFVVDHNSKFVGSVSLHDVRRVILDQDYLSDLLIALDLVNSNIPSVTVNDDLDTIMKLFGTYDLEELPVVDKYDKFRIIGSIYRKNVIDAYNRELVKRNISQEISGSIKLLEKVQSVDFIDDYIVTQIEIPPSFVNKSLKEIDIRSRFGVQILIIKRKTDNDEFNQIVPAADEKFQVKDILVVMGKNKEIETLKHVV
jgi:CIC family chloride channel protein